MNKILTKKNILLGSIMGTLVSLMLTSSIFYEYCFSDGHCWRLYNFIDAISYPFIFFPAVLFFSLITYKMRDQVFHTWRNFALFWIPLSIFFITITPETSGILQVIDKELIAIVFSGLFVILSIIVISVSSVRSRGRGKDLK